MTKSKKDLEKLKEAMKRHAELIDSLPNVEHPKPGDEYCLEMEFVEDDDQPCDP